MKALSIKQPWANLIASGEKTIETRTWATAYRGELALCSSASPRIAPAGCVVAVATLIDCRPMTRADEAAAQCQSEPGRWSWVLSAVRVLPRPVPVKGRLGVFSLDAETERLVRAQLTPRAVRAA